MCAKCALAKQNAERRARSLWLYSFISKNNALSINKVADIFQLFHEDSDLLDVNRPEYFKSIALFCALLGCTTFLARSQHESSKETAAHGRTISTEIPVAPRTRSPRPGPFWLPQSSPREYCNIPVEPQRCMDFSTLPPERRRELLAQNISFETLFRDLTPTRPAVLRAQQTRLTNLKGRIIAHSGVLTDIWTSLSLAPQARTMQPRRMQDFQPTLNADPDSFSFLTPLDNLVIPGLIYRLKSVDLQNNPRALEEISYWWAARQEALTMVCPMAATRRYHAEAMRALSSQSAYQDCRRNLMTGAVHKLNESIRAHGGAFSLQDPAWRVVFALASRKERSLFLQIALRETLPLWLAQLRRHPERALQFRESLPLSTLRQMTINEITHSTVRTWNGDQPAEAEDLSLLFAELVSTRTAIQKLHHATRVYDYATVCTHGRVEYCNGNEGSSFEQLIGNIHFTKSASAFNFYTGRLDALLFANSNPTLLINQNSRQLSFQTTVAADGLNSAIDELTRMKTELTPALIERCVDREKWGEAIAPIKSQLNDEGAQIVSGLAKGDDACIANQRNVHNFLNFFRGLSLRNQPLGISGDGSENILIKIGKAKRWREFLRRLPQSTLKTELLTKMDLAWPAQAQVTELLNAVQPFLGDPDRFWMKYNTYAPFEIPPLNGTLTAPTLQERTLPRINQIIKKMMSPTIPFEDLTDTNLY